MAILEESCNYKLNSLLLSICFRIDPILIRFLHWRPIFRIQIRTHRRQLVATGCWSRNTSRADHSSAKLGTGFEWRTSIFLWLSAPKLVWSARRPRHQAEKNRILAPEKHYRTTLLHVTWVNERATRVRMITLDCMSGKELDNSAQRT